MLPLATGGRRARRRRSNGCQHGLDLSNLIADKPIARRLVAFILQVVVGLVHSTQYALFEQRLGLSVVE